MTEIEKIKELCLEKDITFAALERACGFGNGYLGGLRKGFLPPDRLEKVAKYFGVTGSYIRGAVDDKDLVIKNDNETLLLELFRNESEEGMLHQYLKLAIAMKG